MCVFSEHMRHQLSARDYRMAKTIATVCMGYLICNMPIMIYKYSMGKNANDSPYLKLGFATLYWVQCSFNFIIYAASNKQYREASRYDVRKIFGFFTPPPLVRIWI